MTQKVNFSFLQKAFRSYRYDKLGDTEAALESKHVISVRPTQVGDSDMLGFHRESELGHTDLYTSVRPSSTCAMAWAKSVRPYTSNRSVRDEFGGNLTLSFCIKTNLEEVLVG